MSFDPAIFEAEVALKLIPTEQLPSVAQNALEEGFDGPHVLRMAVLEPDQGWAIDQALSPMLAELGCQTLQPKEAALRLAQTRARHILEIGEDPLISIPYFYRLMLAADHPAELIELGYFDDNYIHFSNDSPEEVQRRVHEALEELLSPALREQRTAERKVAWEREQARAKLEWPFILNSPTGRALLKKRYRVTLTDMRPFLWIEFGAWILAGWAFSSWRTAIIGYAVSIAVLAVLPLLGEYRKMRRERRYILRRLGVPEEQI